jgi:integrase
MEGVPKRQLPFLNHERTRHGGLVWYVRIGKGPRIRLRQAYGSPEFLAAYHAAIAGEAPPDVKTKARSGTLAWLVARYRESTAWLEFSPATRRQRENVLARVLTKSGDAPYAKITRKTIVQGLDRRRETPSAARHFLDSMRGVFQWAVYAELAEIDPTEGVRSPKPRDTGGYHIWTEDEARRYEERWPLGTRQRVAFDVLLYTALRRGDAVRLGKQHERDGLFVLRTNKTGEEAYIPILPPLIESIKAGPTGDLTFIAALDGRNLTKESFGNCFRDWCKAADVPGSAHGLRKLYATRAAQWLTEAQLEAIHGWERGSAVVKIYTKKVDRERLARSAAKKLTENTPRPHLFKR